MASVDSAGSAGFEMADMASDNAVVVVKDEFTSDASEGRVWRMQMDRWYAAVTMNSIDVVN